MMTEFMSVMTVGSPLGEAQPSLNTEEFILRRGSTSAANVGNPLTKNLSSFILREATLEKVVTSVVNVHHLSGKALLLFHNNRQFILEK